MPSYLIILNILFKQYCQNTIEHSFDAYHAVTTADHATLPQYNYCHPTHSTIMDNA